MRRWLREKHEGETLGHGAETTVFDLSSLVSTKGAYASLPADVRACVVPS